MTYEETRTCKDCSAAFTVKSHSIRVRCDACKAARKDREAAKVDADSAAFYRRKEDEARYAARVARREHDTEAYERHLADMKHYMAFRTDAEERARR